MSRLKWMILLKESFIPFLFILVTFVASLLVLDRYIENHDEVTVINLNREQDIQDEPLIITQKLPLSDISTENKKWYIEINSLIDHQSWSAAEKKIVTKEKQAPQRSIDLNLTLAYLYYKTRNYQTGLELLKSIDPENNPRYYYNMGLLLGEQPRFYDDAIGYFEKFMSYKNSSYEALMNIANLHYKKRRYENALKFFLKSADVSQLARKAKALYMAAEASEKINKYDEALNYLNMAIRLDPEMVSARVRRAKLGLKKNPENSVSELENLADLYPQYADTYQIIAGYYLEKNENETALKWMRKGLQQAPNSKQIKSNLGSLYLKMEEYEKSRILFLELSGQFPEEELYHFNLARAYYGLDDYNKALEEYYKALKIRPNYYEAFINLGIIYSRLGESDKGIFYYNKAIVINSTDPTVYFNLGLLYGKQNRNHEALEVYKKAIDMKNNYPEAFYNLASVYTRIKDYNNAEKSYINAIRLNPKYASAYYNLSLLYDKQSNGDKTLETLKNGIKETGATKLMNKLAYEQKERSDFGNALSTFQGVLKKEPENESALLGAATVQSDLKKHSESRKYIEQYLLINPKNPEARYVYLVDLFNLQSYEEADRQYEILNRISPDFRDANKYKAQIALKMKINKENDS